jgi:hypothetical protein
MTTNTMLVVLIRGENRYRAESNACWGKDMVIADWRDENFKFCGKLEVLTHLVINYNYDAVLNSLPLREFPPHSSNHTYRISIRSLMTERT